MLPTRIERDGETYWLYSSRSNVDFNVGHAYAEQGLTYLAQYEELTEADARAKMLIYLIENRLTEVPIQSVTK